MTITRHFYDACPSSAVGDLRSRYRADTTCDDCLDHMVSRGHLSAVDVKAIRYFIDLEERQIWETEQAAQWADIEAGERAMAEMGLR